MRKSPFPYHLPGGAPGDEIEHLETLEALVHDLRRYADGHPPSSAELVSAPLISDWRPVLDTSSTRLAGLVSSHPIVGPGPSVTSRIYAVDRDHRWIRTYSRLWRLGPPLGPTGRRYDA